MANNIDITVTATLADIEAAISRLRPDAHETAGEFSARISSNRRSSYFKDIWAAIAVAAGLSSGGPARITAWGLQDWSRQDDEDGFALSYPAITALQFGADVLTDGKSPEPLDLARVRRRISVAGGVIGTGARQRTVVELDPDLPRATPLTSGAGNRDAFFEFVYSILRFLEIGAMARKAPGPAGESAAKSTILEFLYELQANAVEHGRASRNVRFMRLQKHLFPSRMEALSHAADFQELTDYLAAQPERPSNRRFNLVEASVSDFGPGILDGFLATFAGEAHRLRPRAELLNDLLHRQLSSKSDPNSGLGIGHALAAAQAIGAFVSLRTAEFWLVFRGRLDKEPRLFFKEGDFAKIPGTHWQLLLPDPTHVGSGDERGA
ncbi:hypothetical protein [Bradyrhizobium sp. RT11b]|uniref:hypothetical protein n=1 Tax=Bradyrhizobium sp. RT11b TaxID=3156332 RepID=UPI003398C99A